MQTRVNRNTVSRAYLELEHQGLVQARQGSGFYVTDGGSERERNDRFIVLKSKIEELVMEARLAQVSEQELLDLVQAGTKSLDNKKETSDV